MKFWGFFLSLLGLACAQTPRVTLETPFGALTGLAEPDAMLFLGVPYALPPVGEGRWRRPVDREKAPQSPFDATKYRAACVQPPNGLDPLAPTSEDCLFLNVYVPRRGNGTAPAPAGTYPVMVFLHGGSWEYGDGSFVLYHGTFVASRRDVVIVAINYRLSVMGFIGSEALAGEDARGSTGNYGLQDQRSALRWVQRNIGALGGDPARVLLYGHSAGAGSTTTHLVTPESWPLISRSMSLSGPFADWTSRPLAAAEAHFDRIAAKVGCADANSKAITACMRAVPAETLLHHEANLPGFVVTYTPTVDGVELTAPPQELARQGKIHKIPAIFGTVLNEGSTFLGSVPRDLNATGFTRYLTKRYGAAFGARIEALYPASSFASAWWAVGKVWTDSLMACPARRSVRWMFPVSKTWEYQFVHEPEVAKIFVKPSIGVFHGSELAFIFEDNFALFPGLERELGVEFADYVANFATSGDPNAGGSHPAWPAYDPGTDTSLRIGLASTEAVTGLEAQRCDLWDEANNAGCQVADCENGCPFPCPK